MSPRTLSASTLVFSPLKTAGFLLGGIALAIVIAGCNPAEPEKSETEKQASSAAQASSAVQKVAVETASPTPVPTETVQVPKTAMSPKETYVKFNAEWVNIRIDPDIAEEFLFKIDSDIEAVILKYGSKAIIAQFLAEKKILEAQGLRMMPEFKGELLSSKEIASIQESVNGSTATLKMMTENGPLTVTLVLENNQWKVENEQDR